jgi:hypothetical protein
MSQSASTLSPSPHPPATPDTRLHGRWLILARVCWAGLMLFSLGSSPSCYHATWRT